MDTLKRFFETIFDIWKFLFFMIFMMLIGGLPLWILLMIIINFIVKTK